jgi:hypothetical protein
MARIPTLVERAYDESLSANSLMEDNDIGERLKNKPETIRSSDNSVS